MTERPMKNGIIAKIFLPKPFHENNTKTKDICLSEGIYNKSIGIIPHNNSSGTAQNPPQLEFTSPQYISDRVVSYVGGIGWSYHNNGEYSYVAYYPFSAENSHDNISISYLNQVQMSDNDEQHLLLYDYLYSKSVIPPDKDNASFELNHIGCVAKFMLRIPSSLKDHVFSKMTIVSEDPVFINSASYNISSIISNNCPEMFDCTITEQIQLQFGMNGFSPKEQMITAYMMMMPINLEGKSLKIRLFDSQNELAWIAEGDLKCDENQSAGEEYCYTVSISEKSPFPTAPTEGNTLNILLLGHSFGIDCTEYLPEIIHAADIPNVYIGRFYYANCSLQRYYDYISNPSLFFTYEYSSSDSPTWNNVLNPTLQNVINSKPWDIVVFQQFIGNSGEGDYSTYQPYLDNLISYFTAECLKSHQKVPIFAWNMFWSFSSPRSHKEQRLMFDNYVFACQEMMHHTGIWCIIPSGTAFENLRITPYNTPDKNEFLRDGSHASYCIGRYLASCTWFESLITPIFGVDIKNNTFRPTNHSFPEDILLEQDYPLIWDCASNAVSSPFKISNYN